ncbi:hypothetical protein ACFYTF_29190 [Nocardia thailandica]|uniref:Replication protein n=1 Tax=Nocardia thailandica TaxID=257275 RepID=A0ABW6PX06_9NOCA
MAWGRIDDKMHSASKTIRIPRGGGERIAAIGLWTMATSWCNDHSTDGLVPAYMLDEWGASLDSAEWLCRVGYWVSVPVVSQRDISGPDGTVPTGPISRPEIEAAEAFQFVDWSDLNLLAADKEDKRKAERERKRRWRDSKKASSQGSDADVPPGHVPSPEGVPPVSPLSHTHSHTHISSPGSDEETSTTAAPPRKEEPQRDDVDALCNHLADRMIDNGCKAPRITDGWKREARLLLDSDHRDLGEAMRLIEWCQADQFWRSNIQSMATFRKQYDRLRLKRGDARVRTVGQAAAGGRGWQE